MLDAAPRNQREKIWRTMDQTDDNAIQLEEFTEALLILDLTSTLLRKHFITTSNLAAWIELYIVRSRKFRKGLLLVIILPQLFVASLYGLVEDAKILDSMMGIFYIINWVDFLLRLFTFGFERYFYYDTALQPPQIRKAEMNQKIKLEELTKNRTIRYTKSGNIRHASGCCGMDFTFPQLPTVSEARVTQETSWQKEAVAIANRLDVTIFISSAVLILYQLSRASWDTGTESFESDRLPVIRAALCFTTMRLFTVFVTNRNLMVLFLKVIPEFMSLFMLTLLFMVWFGVIGTTCFHGAFDVMLPEDVPQSNFNTLWQSV